MGTWHRVVLYPEYWPLQLRGRELLWVAAGTSRDTLLLITLSHKCVCLLSINVICLGVRILHWLTEQMKIYCAQERKKENRNNSQCLCLASRSHKGKSVHQYLQPAGDLSSTSIYVTVSVSVITVCAPTSISALPADPVLLPQFLDWRLISPSTQELDPGILDVPSPGLRPRPPSSSSPHSSFSVGLLLFPWGTL